MFPSVCVGCFPGHTSASLWSNAPYADSNLYNFSRKAHSFHISDILHVQNPVGTGTILSQAELRNATTLPLCQASALGPLQAFCTTKNVQSFVSATNKSTDENEDCPSNQNLQHSKSLKFGINRILSEEFGKTRNEKENRHKRPKSPSARQDSSFCNCGSRSCPATFYSRCPFPSHALSAVHSIQPPQYPMSPPGIDSLPGPYSILNDDGSSCNQSKRKRSWSRAVFSNLQRKGLEKRFEVQKYVTKPDRRQLAAMLGLTDAQVKVWFQNRRMKWRHAQQIKDKEPSSEENKEQCDASLEDDISVTYMEKEDLHSQCDGSNET